MTNIALIGYGGMGKYHLSRLAATGIYNIAGIYDNNLGKQSEAEAKGYKVYRSAEELMQDKSVDVVLIATPNDTHCHYAIMAANAIKNVLCEKPVAMNSAELQLMIDAANDNGVMFTVNQNRRYDKDYLTIKNIYDSNTLGGVYKIISNVMGSHGVPGDWRKVKSQGGGMIFDWGVHLIDQALQMVGGNVISVQCRNQYIYGYEVDDGCYITLNFDSGVEYNINIETNAFIALPRWKIYGMNGSAVVKNWLVQGKIVKVKTVMDSKNKGINAGNGFTKTMADRSHSTVRRHKLPKVMVDKDSIYKNIPAAIKGNAAQIVKATELVRSMKVMEACFASAEQNQVIITCI